MSKFTAKKRLNNTINSNFECPSGYEWAKSFNNETTYEKGETTRLIVGTLTPPDGRGERKGTTFPGYFYCADGNDVYAFIDAAFPGKPNLVNLKEEFRKRHWDPKIKEEIIKELKARGIAFLDVVDEAYVLPASAKGSSSDNTIHSYKCDFASFKKVNFSDPDLVIIPNSKNAEAALMHILSVNKTKYHAKNIKLVPQQLMGYWKEYEDKKALKAKWVNTLKHK